MSYFKNINTCHFVACRKYAHSILIINKIIAAILLEAIVSITVILQFIFVPG